MPHRYSQRELLMQAHLTLLEQEAVSRHQETFDLVRAFLPSLQAWHKSHTEWQIASHEGHSIRLLKETDSCQSFPLGDQRVLSNGQSYACVAWVLSFAAMYRLSQASFKRPFSLQQLATNVCECSAQGGPGLNFDTSLADRRSLLQALHYLIHLGYLRELEEGALTQWSGREAEPVSGLLAFTDAMLLLLNAFQPLLGQSPPMERGVLREGAFPSMRVAPLTRAWRMLLLAPALFRRDDPEAFIALCQSAEQVEQEASATFGFVLEMHREYSALVHPVGETGRRVPYHILTTSTNHLHFLFCQVLRTLVASGEWPLDEEGWVRVQMADVMDVFLRYLRPRYGRHWTDEMARRPASELVEELCTRMRRLGLLRGPDADGWLWMLPTASRFGAVYDEAPEAPIHHGEGESERKEE